MNKSNAKDLVRQGVESYIEENIDSDDDSRADKLHEMMRHLTVEQRLEVVKRSLVEHRDKISPMMRYKMKKFIKKMEREIRIIKKMDTKAS